MEQDKQLTFHDLLEIVTRRKWLVGGLTLMVGVIGSVIGFAKPEVYTARTVFLVKDPQFVSRVLPTTPGTVPFPRRLDSIEEDVRSMSAVLGVVDDLGLATRGVSRDAAAGRILTELDVRTLSSREGDTTVILGYEDTSPRLAAAVVNQVREQYINERINDYKEQVKRVLDRKTEIRKQLEEEQEERRTEIEEIEKKHLMDVGTKTSSTQKQLDQIEANLKRIDLRLKQKRKLLATTLERLGDIKQTDVEREEVRNPRYEKAKTREANLREGLRELEEKYTEKHPKLISARKDYERAQKDLEGLQEVLVKTERIDLSSKYIAAKEREAELREQLRLLEEERDLLQRDRNTLARTAKSLPAIRARHARLEEQEQRGLVALTEAIAREKQAEQHWRGVRDSAKFYFEVVDEARPPIRPSGPNRFLWVAGSLALGLGLGIGISVILHLLSRSLLSVHDAKSFLDVPVMGAVQSIQSNLELERARRRRAMAVAFLLVVAFTGLAFTVVYKQFPELLPGFVRDSITAFREQIR